MHTIINFKAGNVERHKPRSPTKAGLAAAKAGTVHRASPQPNRPRRSLAFAWHFILRPGLLESQAPPNERRARRVSRSVKLLRVSPGGSDQPGRRDIID